MHGLQTADATVWMVEQWGEPANVLRANPEQVRAVILLRDPVDRAFSAYEYHYLRHMHLKGIDPASRGQAGVKPRPMTFLELATQEIEHLQRCLGDFAKAHGKAHGEAHGGGGGGGGSPRTLPLVDLSEECYKKRTIREQWPDSRWTTWPFVVPRKSQWVYRSMIARGRYADQLAHYFAEWPAGGAPFLHVGCSEDLLERPAETMAGVAAFLGLDADAAPDPSGCVDTYKDCVAWSREAQCISNQAFMWRTALPRATAARTTRGPRAGWSALTRSTTTTTGGWTARTTTAGSRCRFAA